MNERITGLIEDYRSGRIDRRRFLKMLTLYTGGAVALSSIPGPDIMTSGHNEAWQEIPVRIILSTSYKFEQLLAGPDKPEDFPAWLAGMKSYRKEMQAVLRGNNG